MNKKEREYDFLRKEETLKKLKNGLKRLREKKSRSDDKKPITKYALSKYTKISNKTINKYPEILNELGKEQENGITIANVAVKIQKIYSLNEAVPIIERLNEMYNEVAKKANEYNKINTKLSYDIIKLKQEVKELNVIIGRYKEKLENR